MRLSALGLLWTPFVATSQPLGIGYITAWHYVQRVKAGRLRADMRNLSP
jgi:hypothetical protein